MSATPRELATCISDFHLNIVSVDDRYARLFGCTQGELVGRNVIELTHPDNRGTNIGALEALRAGGAPFSILKRYLRPGQTSIWVRNHVSVEDRAATTPRLRATVEVLDRNQDEVTTGWWEARAILTGLAAGEEAFGRTILSSPAHGLLVSLYLGELEGTIHTPEQLAACLDISLGLALRWAGLFVARDIAEVEAGGTLAPGSPVRITPEGFKRVHAILRKMREGDMSAG